jgi:hypothetical protein
MASVWTAAAGGAATGGRPRAGWSDDLAAALLGTWVVAGLFLDGWAHVNQPGLETFFSPWHAIFYAGFLVSAVVLARLVARFQRGGRLDPALIPAGYGLGLVGWPCSWSAGSPTAPGTPCSGSRSAWPPCSAPPTCCC